MNISSVVQGSTDISQALEKIENDIRSGNIQKILEAVNIIESIQKQVSSILHFDEARNGFLEKIRHINKEIFQILKISLREIDERIRILEIDAIVSRKTPIVVNPILQSVAFSPPASSQKVIHTPTINTILGEQIAQFFRSNPRVGYTFQDLQEIFGKQESITKEELQNSLLFARAQLNKNGKIQLQQENGLYRFISREKIQASKKTTTRVKKAKTLNGTLPLLKAAENIDTFLGGIPIRTLSACWIEKNKKEFKVQIGENIISFSASEYKLFQKFMFAEDGEIQLITNYYSLYNNIKIKLENISAGVLIPIFEKRRKKKKEAVKIKVLKNLEIPLSEEENIEVQLGKYFLKTQKVIGKGLKRKFYIQAGEKILTLTSLQNTLLKILCETEDKLTIEKEQFYAFHSLLKVFQEAELYELANLLGEKRKTKEKIIQVKTPKNIEVGLSETEKINVKLGEFFIQTISRRGNGKKQIFLVQINDKTLQLTPTQYAFFKLLCETNSTLEIEKIKLPLLRTIKILLNEANLGELADLLGKKRKTKEKIVQMKEVKDTTQLLSEAEKIQTQIGSIGVVTLSVRIIGGNNKKEYVVQIGGKDVAFTQAEYGLFTQFIVATQGSIEFTFNKQYTYYKNIRAKLEDIGVSELIDIFDKKRKKTEKKEKIIKPKVKKKKEIVLSESETIDTQLGEYSLRTEKAVGNGAKRKFYIQVGEKKVMLTPLQNTLFKILCECNDKIEIEKDQLYAFRSLLDVFCEAELLGLANLLSEKRKTKEKIVQMKEVKDTTIQLNETEKIDTQISSIGIRTVSARNLGNNKSEYLVKVGENTISLTQAEYRLFFQFIISPEGTIEFRFNNQPTYYKNIRSKLEQIRASQLIEAFEKKKKKKEKVNHSPKTPVSGIFQQFTGARVPREKAPAKPDPLSSNIYSPTPQTASVSAKSSIEVDNILLGILKKYLLENPQKYFSYTELYETLGRDSGMNFVQVQIAILLFKAQEERIGNSYLKISSGMIGYFPPKVFEEKIKKTASSGTSRKTRNEPKINEKIEAKLIEIHPSEFIDTYVLGSIYKTLGKIIRGSITSYKIQVGNTHILLTEKEFKVLGILLQKKGKILKILPNYLPAIRTLSKKLPENHIRNARGEGYYIGEYSPDIIQTNRRAAQIDIPLEKKDYTFENDTQIQKAIIELFEEHPGRYFTLPKLQEVFGGNMDIRTQFLMAKARYNNPDVKILETKFGWTILPEVIEEKKILMGNVEVIYLEEFSVLLSFERKVIFNSPTIGSYIFKKGNKLMHKRITRGSHLNAREPFIQLLAKKFPHLIVEKDGSITARGEHDLRQREKIRLANLANKKLPVPSSE